MTTWDDLDYWSSPEWYTVQERLDELDEKHIKYNPTRDRLFAALTATPMDTVRVAIVGQDPYPSAALATGLAFSIPETRAQLFPPTLLNIFKEYVADLHLPHPTTGCLNSWAAQGVLLWNAVPSCRTNLSLSHDWEEWKPLTKEIIECLSDRNNCVFVFLGRVARNFAQFVDTNLTNVVLEIPHPSPKATSRVLKSERNLMQFDKFDGCRMFSTINANLQQPIDWRLP